MIYTASYASPLGGILLAADELGLTGLWFTGAKYFGAGLPASAAKAETPILAETRRWLDIYFAGQCPAVLPPLHPSGSPFRRAVQQNPILKEGLPIGQLHGVTEAATIRNGIPYCQDQRKECKKRHHNQHEGWRSTFCKAQTEQGTESQQHLHRRQQD